MQRMDVQRSDTCWRAVSDLTQIATAGGYYWSLVVTAQRSALSAAAIPVVAVHPV